MFRLMPILCRCVTEKMKRVESVLRRFHLMKDQPESDARQRLKKELFAFNFVSILNYFCSYTVLYCLHVVDDNK